MTNLKCDVNNDVAVSLRKVSLEKFDETEVVFKNRTSKQDRKCNGQKNKTQTIVYNTQHSKLNIEQNELHRTQPITELLSEGQKNTSINHPSLTFRIIFFVNYFYKCQRTKYINVIKTPHKILFVPINLECGQ